MGLLGFIPEKDGSETLYAQLFHYLCNEIQRGNLGPGTKLPSTRLASEEWAISRSVIVQVYEQLIAEGWIEARNGLGSYISQGVQYEASNQAKPYDFETIGFGPVQWDRIDFRSGIPDPNLFPQKKWSRSIFQVLKGEIGTLYSYHEPQGKMELRSSISHYLKQMRGMNVDPERVVICSGTTQAINLVCRLLLRGKKKVLLEDPITRDIPLMIEAEGGRPYFSPVEADGISLDTIKSLKDYCFLYVTPSHQFPLGVVLSAEKRIRLLELSLKSDCYLIEDDYDSEFRYSGMPLNPLYNLNDEKVIYIGTFSKTLAPGLRIAYLVLPSSLVDQTRHLKWLADLHNPVLEQLVLSEFIDSGSYYSHIKKSRAEYKMKSDYLQIKIKEQIPQAEIIGGSAGMHIVISMKDFSHSEKWAEGLQSNGVRVYPVSIHSRFPDRYKSCLILGFAHLSRRKIDEGIEILGASL